MKARVLFCHVSNAFSEFSREEITSRSTLCSRRGGDWRSSEKKVSLILHCCEQKQIIKNKRRPDKTLLKPYSHGPITIQDVGNLHATINE